MIIKGILRVTLILFGSLLDKKREDAYYWMINEYKEYKFNMLDIIRWFNR